MNRPLPFFNGFRKRLLLALKTEMDCDQSAMGLPPAACAVSLIAKSFYNMGVLEENLRCFCYPFGMSGMFVCKTGIFI
jgi:hypothetical protein